jgi:hypothetical protein
MTHLEATTAQVTLASRPVKILADYFSHSSPLIRADLTACFGGGLPVLMSVDLNAEHVHWNSPLTTRWGKLEKIPTGAIFFVVAKTYEASFQTSTSSRRGIMAGVAQGALIFVLFCLFVYDMPSLSGEPIQ